MPSSSQRQSSSALPVRIEVRHGAAPPIGFDVLGDEFVIGSIPGCDLRIPGANLPPQVCIIQRTNDGVQLRKVAPALPILVDGSPIPPAGQVDLHHGAVISVGAVDLHVAIGARLERVLPIARPAPEPRPEEWDQKRRELEARAKALEEQARELEVDRVLWYERRKEIESETAAARAEADALRQRRDEDRPSQEAELRAQIEQQVAEEYRTRREEVERLQLAVREAAVQLREKKQQFEDTLKNADPRLQEIAERERALHEQQRAVETHTAELRRLRDAADNGQRVQEVRLQQREQDLARREVDLAARELAARELAATAERDRALYQTDLVRVDRLGATIEARERALELRAAEIDERLAQLQNDGRDLEETLQEFDAREERAKDAEARLLARQEELDGREAHLNSRLAEIETQQITLVALRGRLELLRDELQTQEARLAAERASTDEDARQADTRLKQAETETADQADSFREYQERSALMTEAAERLRTLQDQIAAENARLEQQRQELDRRHDEQIEQAGLIKAKAEYLVEAQDRLEADRVALRERETILADAEATRATLQEQLRQRADELASRQRELDASGEELEARAAELSARLQDASSSRRLSDEEMAALGERDEKLRAAEAIIAEQSQQLEEAKTRFALEQAEAKERLAKARAEIDELKEALSARTKELLGQMPDLEERAQSALERTGQAREAMRAQLAELHAYTVKSQEDLQTVRSQVQEELGRLGAQEQALSRAKTEHRLAVASFRQQLIEWQSRFADLKQTLHHGEERLERREKQVAATAQDLAQRVEQIQQHEREVSEKRGEVDRHLGDMQSWFRKKFREIAETRWSKFKGQESEVKSQGSAESGILQLPAREGRADTAPAPGDTRPSDVVILPLPDDLEPADRQLGELLRALDIVERETLLTLWDEARRQRRTLRQVLLAGGFLTLYQLALIESGHLAGLMLGRFRVVDRLMSSPRESIYRVVDPQSKGLETGTRNQDGQGEPGTCVLRHLGEAEILDAVRPDAYRQRFGAARDLAHPNVAATLEVLEINKRPAVIQEWLHGLPGSEWPAAVSAPGVWHRLMMQAAFGLHAAHNVGLRHGRLSANSFLLTRPGVVKLLGIGEPHWLHGHGAADEPSVADDLRSLGQVALGWMNGGRRKGVKPKPFPQGLIDVLRSLGVTPEEGGVPLAVYASAAALLEDLDRAAAQVPADQSAWERLLGYVGENAGDGQVLRQSA